MRKKQNAQTRHSRHQVQTTKKQIFSLKIDLLFTKIPNDKKHFLFISQRNNK